MPLSRRQTLALIGGGVVVAATASAGAFLGTRTPTAAFWPWQAAGRYRDPRLNALSWAILAPSPHNRQPWAARLVGHDTIALYLDPARTLPHTDPFNRQMTIGMGCFMELLVMAAAQQGDKVTLTLTPDDVGNRVALAHFQYGGTPRDPLFAHVLDRRSCKEPYGDRPLSASAIATLSADAQIVTEPKQVAALRTLTVDAWMVEAATARTRQESVDLMRFGRKEIEANPDGIALWGPLLDSMMVTGVLTRDSQADPHSAGFKLAMEHLCGTLRATPAYAVLTTAGNSRLDQIEAGRRWMRLWLAATGGGLSMHPVSQCLQEFPEMADARAQAHQMLAMPGQTVQMLGRLGYGPSVPRTPRWPLQSRLLDVL